MNGSSTQAPPGAVVQPAPVPPAPTNPTITLASAVVVVKKSYTAPARQMVTLGVSATFARTGTLTRSSNAARLFDTVTGGSEITFNGTDNVLTGAQLTAGVQLFAEGAAPSVTPDDIQLTLTLAAGTTPVGPPATATMTAVALTLDIAAPRPAPGTAPPPLAQPPATLPAPGTATDKWFGGRLLSVQDGNSSQDRALLIVRAVQPSAFNGILILRQVTVDSSANTIGNLDNKAQIFDDEIPGPRQTPPATETAKNNPHEFNASTVPAAGLEFWVEGRNASATDRDSGFQLGIKAVENDGDRIALTVAVAPIIVLASPVVLVKKTYTNPARQQVTLRTSGTFTRTGSLTRSSNAIRFFDAATGGNEITLNGTDNVFTGAQLTAGITIFAQGDIPSTTSDDVQLTLTLTAGATPTALPTIAVMTAVALTLDILTTRTAAGTDANPLPQPPATPPAAGTTPSDKWFGGRFVHIQDPGNHQGRALIIVRQVQPAAFSGDLVLRQVAVSGNNITGLDTKIEIFENELQTAGDAAKANPFEFNTSTVPAAGRRLFVEGKTVSAALRDTGFQLGIKDLENDGDRIRLTAVRFSNLQADIPSTAANTARMGNSPVARHILTRGAGAALTASDFDEDFTANAPLVLLEGTVTATNVMNLSVQVAPAGVPVSWSIQRDTRPAPNGDHPDIIAFSPNPQPTLNQVAANPLRATLVTNAVGSFHIRPFIDVNGSGQLEHNDPATGNRIDREPFIIMNLILVRVQGFQNNSVRQQGNVSITPAAPTAATGVTLSTGGFGSAAVAGVHNDASVNVIGGGRNGRQGLGQVFAGWVNNAVMLDGVAEFTDTAPPGTVHRHTLVFVNNNPSAVPGRVGFFIPVGTVPPAGLSTSFAVPGIEAFPFLDVSPFLNPGTGGNTAVGTEGAVGPPVPIVRTPLPTATNPLTVGEEWKIEEWDSPGFGTGPNHLVHPGNLSRFRFNVDFRIDLCFWSNVDGLPAPTAPPGGAACRLYSSVQTNTWTVRLEITFNAAGVATIVTPATVALTQDPNPVRLATPVNGSGLEVRAPIALSLAAIDART